ncbi:MAG TPA: aldehyde ferredoxin oxidoreductase family protein [Thermoleophilia bacterium]|nr:aldehyde ferredoxin oxidoreductase family protein [Thermoleophilia bacterium]
MAGNEAVHGFNGKILHADLSIGTLEIEEPSPSFYRTYLGGGLLGSHYVFKGTRAGIDPLSPENVLVFAPSVVTGAPVMGASRFNVSAKSPLTGAIGDAQCGGDWGAKLKHAGFDAVVIRGRSRSPVYLCIDAGRAEIRDAAHLWGKTTGDAQALIRDELQDARVEVAQIGPAGENLVRFACITGGLSHFAGRTGMGAVMGSKNLKAIAVRGRKKYRFFDDGAVQGLAKRGVDDFRTSEGLQAFSAHGTGLLVSVNRTKGNIATHNFREGDFEGLEALYGETMTETILTGRDTCFACPIKCKRVVQTEAPYRIDGRYGGPEFETIVTLGPNLGIGDLEVIAKASEICNKYGMDTISAGGVIALAMECRERGLLDREDASGLALRFGDKETLLGLLEMIAHRQGIGDILADGPLAAAAAWAKGSEDLAMHSKNQPFAAHMPQIKPSMALMYAVSPSGPDHMACEHDWIGASDNDLSRGLGITDLTDLESLDTAKVKATMLSQLFYSAMDTLTLCHFVWGPGAVYSYEDLCRFVYSVTGWSVSFWELMRAGERRVTLMKAFNAREGLGVESDTLPARMFEPLLGGTRDGARVDGERFPEARSEYYEVMGWDRDTGVPSSGTLMDLGLDWVIPELGGA